MKMYISVEWQLLKQMIDYIERRGKTVLGGKFPLLLLIWKKYNWNNNIRLLFEKQWKQLRMQTNKQKNKNELNIDREIEFFD